MIMWECATLSHSLCAVSHTHTHTHLEWENMSKVITYIVGACVSVCVLERAREKGYI